MTDKGVARTVGTLFIVATAAATLSQVAVGSLLDDPGYLTKFSTESAQVRLGAVLDVVTAAAVAAIAVMLYPILKRYSEAVSVGYLSARVLEAAVIVVGALDLLALLAASQDFVAASPADAASFEASGSLLLSTRDLIDAMGTQLIFSLTALILNYALYQSRLVPRFISVWGLIGAPLMTLAGLLALFGRDPFSTTSVVLVAPLAINEMVLAVWLIVKGFNAANAPNDQTPAALVVGSTR